ncbi:MAG: hypothetical protein FWG55_08145 [Candidatus Bathyarchaeota archaeon]|nr:hypothetical protein [Candidatus Termiticorpusculum sp.]
MSSRIKIFGIVALIGFIAGVIAQLVATYFIPWIVKVLPSLGDLTSFIVAGVAGAIITVVIIGAWAYMTRNKDRY